MPPLLFLLYRVGGTCRTKKGETWGPWAGLSPRPKETPATHEIEQLDYQRAKPISASRPSDGRVWRQPDGRARGGALAQRAARGRVTAAARSFGRPRRARSRNDVAKLRGRQSRSQLHKVHEVRRSRDRRWPRRSPPQRPTIWPRLSKSFSRWPICAPTPERFPQLDAAAHAALAAATHNELFAPMLDSALRRDYPRALDAGFSISRLDPYMRSGSIARSTSRSAPAIPRARAARMREHLINPGGRDAAGCSHAPTR